MTATVTGWKTPTTSHTSEEKAFEQQTCAAIIYQPVKLDEMDGEPVDGEPAPDTLTYIITTDFDKMTSLPPEQLIYGDSIADLEQKIMALHPGEDGVTFLEPTHGKIYVWDKRYRRYNNDEWVRTLNDSYSDREKQQGWQIRKTGYLENCDSIAHLTAVCIKHKVVLIQESTARVLDKEGGQLNQLASYGFALTKAKEGGFFVRWNKQILRRREYRKAMAEYEKRVEPHFDHSALCVLGKVVDPHHWQHEAWQRHEYSDIITGIGNDKYSLDEILKLIRLTTKIFGRKWIQRAWLNQKCDNAYYKPKGRSMADALPEVLENLHAVENRCSEAAQWECEKQLKANHNRMIYDSEREEFENYRFFCRWLRTQARLAKVKIPHRPIKPDNPDRKGKQKGKKRDQNHTHVKA